MSIDGIIWLSIKFNLRYICIYILCMPISRINLGPHWNPKYEMIWFIQKEKEKERIIIFMFKTWDLLCNTLWWTTIPLDTIGRRKRKEKKGKKKMLHESSSSLDIPNPNVMIFGHFNPMLSISYFNHIIMYDEAIA